MYGYGNEQCLYPGDPGIHGDLILLLRGSHAASLFAWTIAKTAIWEVTVLHLKKIQLLILKCLPEAKGLVGIFIRDKGPEKCHCWHSTLLAQASVHWYNLTKAEGKPHPQCSAPGFPKITGVPSPQLYLLELLKPQAWPLPPAFLPGLTEVMGMPCPHVSLLVSLKPWPSLSSFATCLKPIGKHSPHRRCHLIVWLWWPKGLVILGPRGLKQSEWQFWAGYHTQGTTETADWNTPPVCMWKIPI